MKTAAALRSQINFQKINAAALWQSRTTASVLGQLLKIPKFDAVVALRHLPRL